MRAARQTRSPHRQEMDEMDEMDGGDEVSSTVHYDDPSRKRQPHQAAGPRPMIAPKALGTSLVIAGTGLDAGGTGNQGGSGSVQPWSYRGLAEAVYLDPPRCRDRGVTWEGQL